MGDGGHETVNARIARLYETQKAYFRTGATLPREAREERLSALAGAIKRHAQRIVDACREDMGRPELEAHVSEVALPLSETKSASRQLRAWLRPRRSLPPLVNLPGIGETRPRPLGLNLIVAPWNYPFLLTLAPLASCIAAGNVAILKPSELAPASSRVLAEIIADAFPPDFVTVVEGGVAEAQALLRLRFDHFFFTGSTRVGRIVAKAAAEHLARATLELGGKSPTIVTESADLRVAARRIALGKFFNAGQSCVAPDYVLAHESVHDAFVQRMGETIREAFGADAQRSPDFGRIINAQHFARVVELIDAAKVRVGGKSDAASRYVEPTVLADVSVEDPVMQEEIFGPVLPVLRYRTLEDVVAIVDRNPNPLALYVFTADREQERWLTDRIPFGGGTINGTLLHFADCKLPLGGIGESGLGASRGWPGFLAFSHVQGVLRAATFLDPSLRYPPYTERKKAIIRRIV